MKKVGTTITIMLIRRCIYEIRNAITLLNVNTK